MASMLFLPMEDDGGDQQEEYEVEMKYFIDGGSGIQIVNEQVHCILGGNLEQNTEQLEDQRVGAIEVPVPVPQEDPSIELVNIGGDNGGADLWRNDNKSKEMSYHQFCAEMEESICSIVEESIHLFGRDPKMYHPFYLRIFKYIKMGERMGYVPLNQEGSMFWWRKFDKFAEDQWNKWKEKGEAERLSSSSVFTKEKSPYAIYINTKQVLINGVKIKEKRNLKERNKLFKSLEEKVKEMRKDNGGNLMDLEERLKFFGECQVVTYPADCIKMNNLWSKLLEEKKRPSKNIKTIPEVSSKEEAVPEISPPKTDEVKVKPVINTEPVKEPFTVKPAPATRSSPPKHKPSKIPPTKRKNKITPNKSTKPLQRILNRYKSNLKSKLKSKSTYPLVTKKLEKILCSKIPLQKVSSKKTSTALQKSSQLPPKRTYKKKVRPPQGDMSQYSTPLRSHVCDLCGHAFVHARNLRVHQHRTHDPSYHMFQCPICPHQRFKQGRTLWQHYYRHHMEDTELPGNIQELLALTGSVKDKVNVKFDSLSSMNFQSKVCGICGKSFTAVHSLKRHHMKEHEHFEKHVCQDCGKEFKGKDVMMAHRRKFHTGEDVTRCDLCGGKDQGSGGRLWKHRVEVHKWSGEEAAIGLKGEVRWGACEWCGELLLEGKQWGLHVKEVHGEKWDEWWKEEERKRKVRKNEVKREARRKWKEERVGPEWLRRDGGMHVSESGRCGECGIWVDRGMRKHLRAKHGVTQLEGEEWRCEKEGCGRVYGRRMTLTEHLMECHCELEEKIVESKIVRRELMMGWIGGESRKRWFRCTLCGEGLWDRGEVKVHLVDKHREIYRSIIRGEGIRLPCPIGGEDCGGFKGEEELRSHLGERHGDKCWRCPEETCGKVMLRAEEMGVHWLKEHGGGGGEEGNEELGVRKDLGEGWMEKRCGVSKFMGEDEKREKERKRRMVYYRSKRIEGKCELCANNGRGTRLNIGTLQEHLKRVHGVKEDIWSCEFCGGKNGGFLRRESWMAHMELRHGDVLNKDMILERARVANVIGGWEGARIIAEQFEGETKRVKRKIGPKSKFGSKCKNAKRKVKRVKWDGEELRRKRGVRVRRGNRLSPELLQMQKNLEREKRLVIGPLIRVTRDVESGKWIF